MTCLVVSLSDRKARWNIAVLRILSKDVFDRAFLGEREACKLNSQLLAYLQLLFVSNSCEL